MSPIVMSFCLFTLASTSSVCLVFASDIPGKQTQMKAAAPVFTNSTMKVIITKEYGDDVNLKCEAKGTPTPNITWFRDNLTSVVRVRLPVTYKMWSIMMHDLTSEDTGNYGCIVCNKLGCVQHVYALTVKDLDAPIIKSHLRKGYPGNTTSIVHASVELACPTTVDAAYTTDWFKVAKSNYTAIDYRPWTLPSKKLALENKGKYVIRYDNRLLIRNVTKADEGWYKCKYGLDSNESSTGYLIVLDEKVTIDSATMQWLIPTAMTVVCISIAIVVVIYLKMRRNNMIKEQATEFPREVKLENWKKIVSIQRTISNGYITEDLQIPVVKVEKQRLTAVKANYTTPTHASEYVFPVDTDWEISRKNLNLGKVLGEGEFGRVVQVECVKLTNSNTPSTVAVKMLKEGHSDADVIAFVSEMEIMKMIGKHENIINLLGCCSQDGPLYVVVEYASNGSLRKYLKKHKPNENTDSIDNLEVQQLTQQDLIEFSLQVAKGMEYLSSRGCIHRDLAARNVLVSHARVLKVADFGLARDVRDSDYYRKRTAGKLPVRWMAPESLAHNYYTKKSDVFLVTEDFVPSLTGLLIGGSGIGCILNIFLSLVMFCVPSFTFIDIDILPSWKWSFGVLMWEIMTFGNTPYSQIPVHYLYNYFRLGKRMEKPNNCRQEIYDLMKHCCSFSPDDRPTFTEVKELLESIYSKALEH